MALTNLTLQHLGVALGNLAAQAEVKTILENAQVDKAAIDATIRGGVADAEITVGAEASDIRAIEIQLKDETGANLAQVGTVEIGVYADAAAAAFATTGGSTGIAIGTDGALLAKVAKKLFQVTSEPDGHIDLTWTDIGTEAAYLGVFLPNGTIVMSSALTNA